ncbi:hypothetical protein ACFOLF_18260 [Paenibacillus sepulcri]|uniref:Response regulatory domain-containing protein n=1 Tax=Paenibacillus sepulcri TaxID=359917 RepID=A0ABS7BXA0_9BACL|nr:hypothetical protein [Paenibacillus sepulcri]
MKDEGANDFIARPFDRTEVIQRIHNPPGTRYYHLQHQDQTYLKEN